MIHKKITYMKNKGTCVLFSNKETKINRQGRRNTRLYI